MLEGKEEMGRVRSVLSMEAVPFSSFTDGGTKFIDQILGECGSSVLDG